MIGEGDFKINFISYIRITMIFYNKISFLLLEK